MGEFTNTAFDDCESIYNIAAHYMTLKGVAIAKGEKGNKRLKGVKPQKISWFKIWNSRLMSRLVALLSMEKLY